MIGILLIDHGSRYAEANALLHEVAALVQRLADSDVIVRPAHMELAEPSVAKGLAECVRNGATEVVAVPYMLAPGRHASSDIPRLVAEAALEYPQVTVRVTGPLGLDTRIGAVVLERAAT